MPGRFLPAFTTRYPADLTPQPVGETGLAPVHNAAATPETITPDNRTFIDVANNSANPVTVTITCTNPCTAGQTTPTHDQTVTVPAGESRMIPTGPPARYADPDTGLATVTYTATTAVSRAAVRL